VIFLLVYRAGSIVGGRFGATGARRIRVEDTTFIGQVRRAVASARRTEINRVTVVDGFAGAVTASRRVVINDSTITGMGPDTSPEFHNWDACQLD
jgi:hypothetical protein